MATYKTQGNGQTATIRYPDGREVFLQDEDASILLSELGECTTDRQVQNVLESYEYIAEPLGQWS